MNIKTVNKPWGNELWIADGERTPYALKRILFKAGNRTSLQVHEYKFETNYVLFGSGKLYLSNGMSEQDVKNYENSFDIIDLKPGVVFDVAPGFVHRVVALSDLEFIEVSTPHLDDVIRLQDDQGRTHGKIDKEHE